MASASPVHVSVGGTCVRKRTPASAMHFEQFAPLRTDHHTMAGRGSQTKPRSCAGIRPGGWPGLRHGGGAPRSPVRGGTKPGAAIGVAVGSPAPDNLRRERENPPWLPVPEGGARNLLRFPIDHPGGSPSIGSLGCNGADRKPGPHAETGLPDASSTGRGGSVRGSNSVAARIPPPDPLPPPRSRLQESAPRASLAHGTRGSS